MNLSAEERPAKPAGKAVFAVECRSLATSESITVFPAIAGLSLVGLPTLLFWDSIVVNGYGKVYGMSSFDRDALGS
jgi:hypothetical protein